MLRRLFGSRGSRKNEAKQEIQVQEVTEPEVEQQEVEVQEVETENTVEPVTKTGLFARLKQG